MYAVEYIDKMRASNKKKELTDDSLAEFEDKVQKITDKFIAEVDSVCEKKTKTWKSMDLKAKNDRSYDTDGIKSPGITRCNYGRQRQMGQEEAFAEECRTQSRAENLKELCRNCGRYGVSYLTVYAFQPRTGRDLTTRSHSL